MTWNNDDDLGGEDMLSDRQRAAVNRLRGRQGRHQRDRHPLSRQQEWADFTRAADQDENWRFSNS